VSSVVVMVLLSSGNGLPTWSEDRDSCTEVGVLHRDVKSNMQIKEGFQIMLLNMVTPSAYL